jgi:hypothetical protein
MLYASSCEFLERNVLYFELSKNDKISQKDKIEFSVHCSPRTKPQLVFLSPKYYIYLVLKNYTLIEYNIVYILVFFFRIF